MSNQNKEMISPFINDPFAIIYQAYKNLFDKPFKAFWGQRGDDEECQEGYGFTDFPADGGVPTVVVYTEYSTDIQAETLAHELAHVAAGPEHEHDEVWEKAFSDISASDGFGKPCRLKYLIISASV